MENYHIDPFMRILLTMRPDETRELREELDRTANNFIRNNSLQNSILLENNLMDYNIEYIQSLYRYMKKQMLNAYGANIISIITSMFNSIGNFQNTLNILQYYVDGIRLLNNPDLSICTNFNEVCVLDPPIKKYDEFKSTRETDRHLPAFQPQLLVLHTSYYSVRKMVKEDDPNIREELLIKPIDDGTVITGFYLRFGNIGWSLPISMECLDINVARGAVSYFNCNRSVENRNNPPYVIGAKGARY